MKPQQIDKIADVVVHGISGPAPGLLGCGDISIGIEYIASDSMLCRQRFSCGGEGAFACCQAVQCADTFDCPNPAGFNCEEPATFSLPDSCPTEFTCDVAGAFHPLGGSCARYEGPRYCWP